MSEFGDRFFGVIVIIAFLALVIFQNRSSVHVYDVEQERANNFVSCLFEKLPEGDFTDEQYNKAETLCRV